MLERENINNFIADDLALRNRNWGQIEDELAEKANRQQEAWVTPTLLNGWVEFDTSRKIKYAKNDLSLVSVVGCVKGGLLNTTLFQLPVGYRPDQTVKFVSIMGNGQTGGITIDTLGNVVPMHGNVSQFYFGFIIFKAV